MPASKKILQGNKLLYTILACMIWMCHEIESSRLVHKTWIVNKAPQENNEQINTWTNQ